MSPGRTDYLGTFKIRHAIRDRDVHTPKGYNIYKVRSVSMNGGRRDEMIQRLVRKEKSV